MSLSWHSCLQKEGEFFFSCWAKRERERDCVCFYCEICCCRGSQISYGKVELMPTQPLEIKQRLAWIAMFAYRFGEAPSVVKTEFHVNTAW